MISFTYNDSAQTHHMEQLPMNISVTLTNYSIAILTEFNNETYMESIIVLTVLKNIPMGEIKLECSISDLNTSTELVFADTSGIGN